MLVICLSEGVRQSQDRRGRSAVPAWFAGVSAYTNCVTKTNLWYVVFSMMIGYNYQKSYERDCQLACLRMRVKRLEILHG